jgi:lipopolysaccharide transport system ATP-binding protein
MNFNDYAIRAQGLSKCYTLYDTPSDRLKQMLARGRHKYYREFWALRDVSFKIAKGEVLGLVGRNGAGKSTLLQLICNTLTPSAGNVAVRGRVAALLELGAGFNPDFSGRENVYLSATILGLTKKEIDERFDEIIEFSGVRDFIDQPVKTYSSGMYVRLAFSVATSVDPDILIIDEALSVGDGVFARKSFDRIKTMKDAGKTILFCSHSLYHIEAFCDRALWLDQGQCKLSGDPQQVIREYSAFLIDAGTDQTTRKENAGAVTTTPKITASSSPTIARFTHIEVKINGQAGKKLHGRPDENNLSIRIQFESDPALPVPTIGVTFDYGVVITLASVISRTEEIDIKRDEQGRGEVIIDFPALSLRNGEYLINAYLACENALHIYDQALAVATLLIEDDLPDPGLIRLSHAWRALPGHG